MLKLKLNREDSFSNLFLSIEENEGERTRESGDQVSSK